jgi:hypothetical protein
LTKYWLGYILGHLFTDSPLVILIAVSAWIVLNYLAKRKNCASSQWTHPAISVIRNVWEEIADKITQYPAQLTFFEDLIQKVSKVTYFLFM